ncbi:hypothetical protein HK097_011702 [Rhizophlyctis rosea]|uniref:Peptidase M12B domain-containing protein n=1 Tax=Rhizophlyctis rosea TaxID=64517 RepID=A0AAD5S927_9FUNG|nr:hypothetical protein HK097_011702 [Rhizophlyctis rosea]
MRFLPILAALGVHFLTLGTDASKIPRSALPALLGRRGASTDLLHHGSFVADAIDRSGTLLKRAVDIDEFTVELSYRGIPLTLHLTPNTDLFAEGSNVNDVNPNDFLTGYIEGMPDSLVRASHDPAKGVIEGTAYLGRDDLGSLHFEAAAKFTDAPAGSKAVVYHDSDVKQRRGLAKREISDEDRRALMQSLLEALGKAIADWQASKANATATATGSADDATGTTKLDLPTGNKFFPVNPTAGGAQPTASAPSETSAAAPTTAPVATTTQAASTARSNPTIRRTRNRTRTTSRAQPTATQAPAPTTARAPTATTSRPSAASPTTAASTANTCRIGVIAAQSFIQSNPGQNINQYMASLINDVSLHYERQLGVKFSIAHSHVASQSNDPTTLGNVLTRTLSAQQAVDLANFAASRVPEIAQDQDLCAVFVFSSDAFEGSTIGVAYTDSLCESSAYATIATTGSGRQQLSRAELTAVVMHELGHVFGANHDTEAPTRAVCTPGSNRFTMYPAIQPNSANAHTFSQCSLEQIKGLMAQTRCWRRTGGLEIDALLARVPNRRVVVD